MVATVKLTMPASRMENLGLLRIKHEVLVLLLQGLGRLQQDPVPGWRVTTTTAYPHHAYHASTKYPSSDTTQKGETSAMTALQRKRLGLRVKSSELPRLMYLVSYRYRIWVWLCLASEF